MERSRRLRRSGIVDQDDFSQLANRSKVDSWACLLFTFYASGIVFTCAVPDVNLRARATKNA